MALVKHIGSLSESQILALTSSSALWFEKAFYYPNDFPRKQYFYRLLDGQMYQLGSDAELSGVGVKLNGSIIGGVKSLIESNETLNIPVNYEYNLINLQVSGVINCNGIINLL